MYKIQFNRTMDHQYLHQSLHFPQVKQILGF